jgi:CheY-like chemotaxis protein
MLLSHAQTNSRRAWSLPRVRLRCVKCAANCAVWRVSGCHWSIGSEWLRGHANLSMILKSRFAAHFSTSGYAGPAPTPASGRSVLSTLSVISVVDDDASVRAATNKFLRSHGYTVQAYSSAEYFLQSGRLNDTSCVIADLQMPGMSGLELLTMMRAQGYGVPFIFITAFPDETTRARALQAGAICFLSKPFAGPTLINCLGAALEGHRREEDT